jgi:ABC-type lipoprotein export system ATPase subunit
MLSDNTSQSTISETVLEQAYATIVAHDITKEFKNGDEIVHAVDHVTFSCLKQQFVAITGPSGCGKSTLLYLLGSLEKLTSGQLWVGGVDLTTLSQRQADVYRRQQVGFVFQSFHLVPNLTILENVMLPMEFSGIPLIEQRDRAHELLTEVGIPENRHTNRPLKLSGGQQQRVAIARALANQPPVILADEPTGNLDSKNSQRIIELLRVLAHKGRTVIVVTHDLSVAKDADVHIVLDDGKMMTSR